MPFSYFIEDNDGGDGGENVVQQLKDIARGQRIFVIFDDLINSK